MSYNKETGMYEGYIYKITNQINGKIYIGQTTRTIDERWKQHIKDSYGRIDDLTFHRAIRKYKKENFKVECMVSAIEYDISSLKVQLNHLEMFYIDQFGSFGEKGYNMTPGGDGFSSRAVVLYDYDGNVISRYSSVGDAGSENDISSSSVSNCCNGVVKGTRCGVFRYAEDPFDKYDVFDFNSGRINILKYDLDGNIVNTYLSLTELADEYCITVTTVSRWLKNKTIIDNQYVIFRKNEEVNLDCVGEFNDTRINKYNLNGDYMATYMSASDAGRRNDTDASSIVKCCNGKIKQVRGYIYKRYRECQDCCTLNVLPSIPKSKSSYQQLTNDEKRVKRLQKIGCFDAIDVYNSFGEVIHVYDDIIIASEKLNTTVGEILKSCNGEKLKFKKSVLRYHGDSFDKYPRSPFLQPITIYDIRGNILKHCETIIDAEKFVGCCSGDIKKTIDRGGSYKDYLFSYYGEPLTRKTYQMTRKIEMCDESFHCIRVFNSKKDVASYLGFVGVPDGLNDAVKNQTMYMQHYWKYRDEVEINS